MSPTCRRTGQGQVPPGDEESGKGKRKWRGVGGVLTERARGRVQSPVTTLPAGNWERGKQGTRGRKEDTDGLRARKLCKGSQSEGRADKVGNGKEVNDGEEAKRKCQR